MSTGERTLFILPNAIGDVIRGLGVAHRLRDDGPLTWIVNPSAEDILQGEGFDLVHPASRAVRRMAAFGAPVEVLRDRTCRFLTDLRARGPFTRVVNPHLSRAASLMAGAVDAARHHGPALAASLVSDTWSDFLLGSISLGLPFDLPVAAQYSLIAGLHEPAWPRFADPEKRTRSGELIVLQAGSGWPSRRLSVEQASGIADHLSRLGPVALIGSPHEAEYLDAIHRAMKSTPEDYRPGRLRAALDLILDARLVVTTDTWALHAAGAAGKPTLALLGPTRVFPRTPGLALSPRADASWQAEEDDSLKSLSPAFVVAAALAVLESKPYQPADDGTVSWNCEREHPLPSRPLPDNGELSDRAVFAWARAHVFSRLVAEYHPSLPKPSLRSADELRLLYEDNHRIKARLLAARFSSAERFLVFATTFPGQDAASIVRRWNRETFELIDTL